MLALEKIVASFLALPGLLWLICLIITIYLFRRGKSTVIYFLSLINLILMYLLFTSIGTGMLVVPLENMYQDTIEEESINLTYPIVVLGGGIEYGGNRAYLSPYSLQRVVKGYELYQQIKGPIVFTGGVAIGQNEISEAEIAAAWLRKMGVKPDDIIIEDKARTTYENAVYVKQCLSAYYTAQGQAREASTDANLNAGKLKVYLVTNAVHLSRSVLVFEKQGIDVIPVNAGIITDHRNSWLNYLPNRDSLTANLFAIHEWFGLGWYKISKRI